jgi:hypothetical protein
VVFEVVAGAVWETQKAQRITPDGTSTHRMIHDGTAPDNV